MKKVVFVVQRYGLEVNGGAELQCRLFAEKLKDVFDITVLTTCAIDYLSWKNEYEKGEEVINGVKVIRFPVDSERNIRKFNELNEIVFNFVEDKSLGEKWMKEQGPFSSKLLDYIEGNQGNYDFFVFFTYLYATTYFSLPLITESKKFLVPEAHDERPIYLKIFDDVFNQVDGLIYNTEEEKSFVDSRFDLRGKPNVIGGMGVELPNKMINVEDFKRKYGVDDYVLYVGRVDGSKGCGELFNNFLKYRDEFDSKTKLVVMGKPVMDIPKNESIISLGFVSEEDKFAGIMGSKFVINPSQYESLSIILLETFLCKKMILVNGLSEVLKGHCLKSNGGLWYENEDDFLEAFNLLENDCLLREKLAVNGYEYVTNNYRWELVTSRIVGFLNGEL